jgi:hypothetical protein
MSLWSGQGPAFWSNRDANGDPVQFNWFGNAPEFTLGLSSDVLDHKESYSGLRATDARIITELKASVSITVDDFKESNMELASYGVGSQVGGTSVTAEEVVDGAPLTTELYALNTTGRVSAVTLKDNGVSISTTKYTVDASGIIQFSDVAGMTGPITADYTIAASRQVGVFKTAAPEIHVRLDGKNTATSVVVGGSSDFERTIVDIFKARLDPAENFNLINDQFGQLALKGSALTDPTKAQADATGQFARFIYLDPPSQTVPSASASPSHSVSPSHSASPST